MFNFDFLEKGLGIVSPPHHGFSRKIFLKLYSGISENLVVKSRLPPQSDSVALRDLSPIHKNGPCSLKFLLTDQVSLPDHLYFLRYWSILDIGQYMYSIWFLTKLRCHRF